MTIERITLSRSLDSLDDRSNTFIDYNPARMILITKDSDVYDSSGRLLAKFRKNVLTNAETETLYKNCKSAAYKQRGRAEASGMKDKYSYQISKTTGKTIHQLNSKAPSGIMGFYDNKSFFGYKRIEGGELCRQTAYTRKHMDRFQECIPIFQKISQLYSILTPEHHTKQKSAIKQINENYVIPDTVFTTVTVNKNFQTALHKDKGDFKEGMGILAVASSGEYEGMYTLFPEYNIAVDCRNGDLLIMDVHEWHCNSSKRGDGDRLSFVFYLRERMMDCCPNSSEDTINH